MARKRPSKRAPETTGRRLLEIVVYGKCCRIGGSLSLGTLADDICTGRLMPDFTAACSYAVSQD
jgi:hypothetical protein